MGKLLHAGENTIGRRSIIGDTGAEGHALGVEIVAVTHVEHVGIMDALILHHAIIEPPADGGHARIIKECHRVGGSGNNIGFFEARLHRVGHARARDDVVRKIIPVLDEPACDDGGIEFHIRDKIWLRSVSVFAHT